MFSASKTSGPSGYNINNSLRFRRSATAWLNRTPASASNRKTFTYSAWIKRGLSGNNNFFCVNPNTGFSLFALNFDLNIPGDIGVYQNTSGTNTLVVSTNAVFRDFSAWYHVVIAIDTTQATAANRVLIYVNGVSQALTISTQVALNTDLYVNSTLPHFIGREQTASGGAVNYFDGYMAEINFIDGQALTPSSFGSFNATTGVWQPARYTGTYGTNGFYLNFTDIGLTSGSNTGLGRDFSGNGNFWNTNNISVTAGVTYDAMSDVPTLTSVTQANYATLNPLLPYIAGVTLSNGNLNVAYSSGSGLIGVLGTIGISSGKWYWEYTFTASNPNFYLGWRTSDDVIYFGVGCSTGNVLTETTSGSFSGSTVTVTNGDVIGIAFDYAAGACYYYKNNTLFFTLTGFTTSSSTLFPIRSIWSSGGGASSGAVNFGQRPFAYTPPTGFNRLNTFNLPNSTVVKGNTVMDATLATGNNSTQVITNAAGFRPDFVWLKIRSASENHIAYDSVRGAQQYLVPNLTLAEATLSSGLTSFNSNGFTLGNANPNYAGSPTFVGWQWQAGQGTNTTNTAGSITSTVSVNATAGFSIVTYTGNDTSGATVGHGLGVVPAMVICKNRSAGIGSGAWPVWHKSLTGGTYYLFLNTTAAQSNANNNFTATPTSTVLNLGRSDTNNTATMVAYCWAEIAGFSAFGSYTGANNTGASTPNANGPFIYLGFRPKFVLIKRTSSAAQWVIYDSVRGTINANLPWLYPNAADAETSTEAIDFLSNGFKIRSESGATMFPNGATFIYAAFAENPFKNALAR